MIKPGCHLVTYDDVTLSVHRLFSAASVTWSGISMFLFSDVAQHDVFKLMVRECARHYKDGRGICPPPSVHCLIQDKISTSPSPTERRVVVTPRGRARSSHWAIFLLNNIAITNNSTFPKIKLHYSISYCNKTKSNNLI